MSLGLDIEIRGRGRAPIVYSHEPVRPLTREDLPAMNLPRPSSQPSALKRLSDRHHALARAIAGGMSEGEACAVFGYDPSRISILKNDPAFRELLEFYRGKTEEAYVDMHERLANLSSTAVAIIQDRLEDDPEKISLDALMELTKLGADRTGHGPQSKSTQVNINVNMADRLAAARARVAERRAQIEPPILDIE